MRWQLEATEQFERDAKHFAKKYGAEYLAVMENLEKYLVSIEESSHPKLVQFGFLHNEPEGIRAIDQAGGALESGDRRCKLRQTRLYTYANLEFKTLHLLCLGDKTTQTKDIRCAVSAVNLIRGASNG